MYAILSIFRLSTCNKNKTKVRFVQNTGLETPFRSFPPVHSDMHKLQDQKLKNLEAVLAGFVNQKAQELNTKLAQELDKVLDQLNTIQQVSTSSSRRRSK